MFHMLRGESFEVEKYLKFLIARTFLVHLYELLSFCYQKVTPNSSIPCANFNEFRIVSLHFFLTLDLSRESFIYLQKFLFVIHCELFQVRERYEENFCSVRDERESRK